MRPLSQRSSRHYGLLLGFCRGGSKTLNSRRKPVCKIQRNLARDQTLTKCFKVTSFLNLLSLYHDTLLARRLKHISQTDPKSAKSLLPPSPHTRYTKAWSERDPKYKWASRLLEIIRYTQLVLEMGLKRTTGNNGRWRGIVTIEVIRCLVLSIEFGQWD